MTTDPKSETPRTDEAQDHCSKCGLDFVPAEDMEKLELALARRDALLREAVEVMNGAVRAFAEYGVGLPLTKAIIERTESELGRK